MSAANKADKLLEQEFLKEGGMRYIFLAVFFLAVTFFGSACQAVKGFKNGIVSDSKKAWAALKKADKEFEEKYW